MKLYAFNLGMPLPWLPKKLLLIMKIICVLLVITMSHISAKSSAQKITLKKRGVRMVEILKLIKLQSGFSILYKDYISDDRPIDINVENVSIETALKAIFTDQKVEYKIVDKNILLTSKKQPPLNSLRKTIDNVLAGIDVNGRVNNESGSPLAGARVLIKNTDISTVTNDRGEFSLSNVDENATLIIKFVGFVDQEIQPKKKIIIILESKVDKLNEVNVVSTGYQTIPKERATGSFTNINEKTLNRNVGINIIDRLDGVASGLILNRGLSGTNNSKISIHGRSTLFSNPEPLIILDGFPYEGTIEQINPADIESINLLKDAAAASIWGTRAGNGVIVISSKRGKQNQKLKIELTSTFTISGKPDLYYKNQMRPSDFIELEQFLYNQGFYSSRLSENFRSISPAIEIFEQTRLGNLSIADSIEKINELKQSDIRKDQLKYIYRPKTYQQYNVSFSGGSDNQKYYISAGYDKNLENKVSENYDRITLNANNAFMILNNKLEILTDFNLTSSNTKTSTSVYEPLTPYESIKRNGENLAVSTTYTPRMNYVDTAGSGALLDWRYRPLDELQPNATSTLNQYRLKGGIKYNVTAGISVMASYQYLNEDRDLKSLIDQSRFFTRDLINKFSTISQGVVSRVVPLGDYLSEVKGELKSKTFRVQANLNRTVNEDHMVNAIIGYEGSDSRNETDSQPFYGYNPETMTYANATINPLTSYKLFYGTEAERIATVGSKTGIINISQSYFANASYSYKGRYIISGSGRKDESNLFGVSTNQKGVPLWSTGIAWILSDEKFYSIRWLENLKLRATYGYSGNVDRNTSAYLAAFDLGIFNEFNSGYSIIQNPANPDLRWERVKNWNIGLDFAAFNNRITGSFDRYQKNSMDLIGNSPIAPQSGVIQYRGNNSNMVTKGLDVVLNTQNLTSELKWNTTILYNYNTDKVTKYKAKQSTNLQIVSGNYDNPLEGFPYYAIFGFPFGGLDESGKVQGLKDGNKTSDLNSLSNLLDPNSLIYYGSNSPKHFGSVINTFNYKNLALSFNITYKFGYYFRKTNIFSGSNYGSADASIFRDLSGFDKRWQKSGDQLHTQIPALTYPADFTQDSYYAFSNINIEKGDHIRLQDIRLNYNLKSKVVNNANIFLYARNLGIIWRANDLKIDPDFGTSSLPQPFQLSLGVSINLL